MHDRDGGNVVGHDHNAALTALPCGAADMVTSAAMKPMAFESRMSPKAIGNR
jgi:hypothetical protein